MKLSLRIGLFLLSVVCANSQASTITYVIEANPTTSYALLDIVTYADITGRLEVKISGNDIWFANIDLSTDSTPDEGYRLLETAVGIYDGFDFTYESPFSRYFGSFDGTSLTLYTDKIFYSEIYGDVVSVSSVPLPGAIFLFASGFIGLITPKLIKDKSTIHSRVTQA